MSDSDTYTPARTHTRTETRPPTRRRRHAAPGHPRWVRRAGLVGGVLGAFALSGAGAPAMAESAHVSSPGADPEAPAPVVATTAVPLFTAAGARQAADAMEQDAIDAWLAAAKQRAVDEAAGEAARAAAAARKAAAAKAAAEAKAARERAAAARAAASRSAERARPAASPGTPSASSAPSAPAATPAPASSSTVDRLIAFLKAQVGKPYVYGAAGPDAYDCSGLTQAAFASVGVTLPRTSQEQSTVGTPVSLGSLQPGDLIFWGGQGSAHHVAVYLGDNQYLDAANPSSPVGIHPMSDYPPDWAVRVL